MSHLPARGARRVEGVGEALAGRLPNRCHVCFREWVGVLATILWQPCQPVGSGEHIREAAARPELRNFRRHFFAVSFEGFCG